MTHPFDLQNVGCKVYSILTDDPATRDDDKLLLIKIWSEESQAKNISDLFNELLEGTLSHFESIRRMRQKIQERHPALRGEKWDIRHNMQGTICQQLNFFDRY